MHSVLTIKVSCPLPEAAALFDEVEQLVSARLPGLGDGSITRRFEEQNHYLAPELHPGSPQAQEQPA